MSNGLRLILVGRMCTARTVAIDEPTTEHMEAYGRAVMALWDADRTTPPDASPGDRSLPLPA